jgi:hypothetical protein
MLPAGNGGAVGVTDGVFLFPAGTSLTGEPGATALPARALAPGLPSANALAALIPTADWAGRSALGFGHDRRDLAAGDPGGADAEEGVAVDRVDLFFSRREADALREDLS